MGSMPSHGRFALPLLFRFFGLQLIVNFFGTCGSTQEGGEGMSVVAEYHEDARGAGMQLQQFHPLGQ
jgi:hypothetical protein